MLVGILDHNNRCIDHGANGNGDAAKAHDVGRQPKRVHADVGDQDSKRQRDDRHKRASNVEKKYHAHQRNDDAFFDQR